MTICSLREHNPKLTIVSQPTDGIAREVARIMLEHLENGKKNQKSFLQKNCRQKS
ncbi:MAG: hypothetical protein ACLVB1_02950 [Blautia obeum]